MAERLAQAFPAHRCTARGLRRGAMRLALVVMLAGVGLATLTLHVVGDETSRGAFSVPSPATVPTTLLRSGMEPIDRSSERSPAAEVAKKAEPNRTSTVPEGESHRTVTNPSLGRPRSEPAREVQFESARRLGRDQEDSARLAAAREILSAGAAAPVMGRALDVLAALDPGSTAAALQRFVEAASEDASDPASREAARPRAHAVAAVAAGRIRSLARLEGVLRDDHLVDLFEGGLVPVRLAAAQALRDRGDESLAKRLLEERTTDLGHADATVRTEALRDLGRIATVDDLPTLRPLLKDDETQVRRQAVLTLRQVGGPAALEDIRPLLRDEARSVRTAAERTVVMLERQVEQRRGRDRQSRAHERSR